MHRVTRETGPIQNDPDIRIGHARTECKGIDAGRRSKDRIVGHIADGVGAGHGPGNCSSNEFTLIGAAIVHADAGIRLENCTGQETNSLMQCGGFPTGTDHGGIRSKDNVCTGGYGLFQCVRYTVPAAYPGADGNRSSETLFQRLSAVVMGLYPAAFCRRAGIEKGNVQMIGIHSIQ